LFVYLYKSAISLSYATSDIKNGQIFGNVYYGTGQLPPHEINCPRIMSQVTLILQAIERGEKHSSEELIPLVYDELRRLAAARLAAEPAGQTLQPTALVHEAWMRLLGGQAQTWENRIHFFAAAAEAMRRIMIERARKKSRMKHGGGQVRVDIEKIDIADALPDEKILLVDEALEKLEKQDPETARIVKLRFFGGLNNDEIAKITGISGRTIRRQWDYAKAWLFKCMQNK
jgi:RNA polymerase sigma factor (TIGR02999 family)